MKSIRLVVAGIGTDVGKTIASAILCRQLEADYWKPVASGTDDGPVDHQVLPKLVASNSVHIHPCSYVFSRSLSPHVAATYDGKEVVLADIKVPATTRSLIIELAGGVAVPLNDTHTNLDLLSLWRFPVVVVSRHYLGSINHTLLTLESLRLRDIQVAGIVFNGQQLPDTERIIEKLGRVKSWGTIPNLETVEAEALREISLRVPREVSLRDFPGA